MLPATAAVPKELLPIGGRPAIDWILDEAARAGIERVVVVSSRRKPAIERYLKQTLGLQGGHSHDRSGQVRELSAPALEVLIVHQNRPSGLGDAVRVAWRAVGDEPVAVLLPDELIFGGNVLLNSMLDCHAREGTSVVSLLEVPPEEIALYGCAELSVSGRGGAMSVTRCVEKPEAALAPSNYALCGRYVLDIDVREALDSTGPDERGEVQLTSALNVAAMSGNLIGVELSKQDRRIDIGNWAGWFAANRGVFEPDNAYEAPDPSTTADGSSLQPTSANSLSAVI